MSMQPYDARMTAINNQYPGLVLPSDIFNEYERLLAGWNALNELRSGAVDELNALVG